MVGLPPETRPRHPQYRQCFSRPLDSHRKTTKTVPSRDPGSSLARDCQSGTRGRGPRSLVQLKVLRLSCPGPPSCERRQISLHPAPLESLIPPRILGLRNRLHNPRSKDSREHSSAGPPTAPKTPRVERGRLNAGPRHLEAAAPAQFAPPRHHALPASSAAGGLLASPPPGPQDPAPRPRSRSLPLPAQSTPELAPD